MANLTFSWTTLAWPPGGTSYKSQNSATSITTSTSGQIWKFVESGICWPPGTIRTTPRSIFMLPRWPMCSPPMLEEHVLPRRLFNSAFLEKFRKLKRCFCLYEFKVVLEISYKVPLRYHNLWLRGFYAVRYQPYMIVKISFEENATFENMHMVLYTGASGTCLENILNLFWMLNHWEFAKLAMPTTFIPPRR